LFYSRKEVAAMLGVCLPTLDAMVQRGELQPRHVGSRVLFSRAVLARFAGE
jgi:excisionase family DNA binding protein